MVECLTQDQRVAGASLTRGTALSGLEQDTLSSA